MLGSFGLAVAVFASSFYLSLIRDGVEKFLKIVVPLDYDETAMRIYKRSKELIGSWFRMQAVLSIIMGFLVWGGLSLLGVRYAFLIAILAAIFELVPFLGPILSGAVAVVCGTLDLRHARVLDTGILPRCTAVRVTHPRAAALAPRGGIASGHRHRCAAHRCGGGRRARTYHLRSACGDHSRGSARLVQQTPCKSYALVFLKHADEMLQKH